MGERVLRTERWCCEFVSADSGRELADEIDRLLYGIPASPFSVSEVSVSYAPNPFVGGVGAIVTWRQGEVRT